MHRVLLAALLGLTAGALATVVAIERGWLPVRPATKVIGTIPKMSLAEAESHRSNRYQSLRSIEDVLALPGHFTQTEALYTLAGRSDSAAVQHLIFQATGIADPSDRNDALGILFARLTELDPASALALSGTGEFAADRQVEAQVWQSWAKLDLDGALGAAAGLESAVRRKLAAQALFAAYDYWGNDTTERIAEALGMEPDSRTRSIYLARLADKDPAAAVEYIESLRSVLDRRETAAMLGQHFGRTDAGVAASHAMQFDDVSVREAFEHAVTQASAEIDPAATLDTLLKGQVDPQQMSQLVNAFRALAKQDIDQALAYLERIDNPQQLRSLSMTVAELLTHENPERALEWSKENDWGMHNALYMQVLSELATIQPEIAIAEAQGLTNAIERRNAFNVIAMAISQRDPERAVQMLGNIGVAAERRAIEQSIATNWIWHEADAALSWILTLPGSERDELLRDAMFLLSQTDPDAAIRLLPRLDDEQVPVWRARIAEGLAAQRPVAEAQAFIAQYEGSDEYPELVSAVISGLAQNDIQEALRMADRMPAGARKDSTYAGLIMQYANVDPRQAAASLALLTDESNRASATMQVVGEWSRSEPEAAQQWAGNLPSGQQRDAAIMAAASAWDEITFARQRLIDSIDDAQVRKQAVTGVIYRVASSDPEKAERMLEETHLSEEEKQEVRNITRSIRDQSEQWYLQVR